MSSYSGLPQVSAWQANRKTGADKSDQIIECHVPAAAIAKLLARRNVQGMAANSPGMGKMDGMLITYDFAGKSFSKD